MLTDYLIFICVHFRPRLAIVIRGCRILRRSKFGEGAHLVKSREKIGCAENRNKLIHKIKHDIVDARIVRIVAACFTHRPSGICIKLRVYTQQPRYIVGIGLMSKKLHPGYAVHSSLMTHGNQLLRLGESRLDRFADIRMRQIWIVISYIEYYRVYSLIFQIIADEIKRFLSYIISSNSKHDAPYGKCPRRGDIRRIHGQKHACDGCAEKNAYKDGNEMGVFVSHTKNYTTTTPNTTAV